MSTKSTTKTAQVAGKNISTPLNYSIPDFSETQKYALLKILQNNVSDGDYILLSDIGFSNAETMLNLMDVASKIYKSLSGEIPHLYTMDNHIFLAIAINYILVPRINFFNPDDLVNFIVDYFVENQNEIERVARLCFWAAEKDTAKDPLKYFLQWQYESCAV